MKLKRVVITGLGALTPLGNSVKEYWDGLEAGKSGAAPITHFDATHFIGCSATTNACNIIITGIEMDA